jgi:outer membrane protein assembly factor BamC
MARFFSANPIKAVACTVLAAALGACALVSKKDDEYIGAPTLPPLQVPPGLDQPPPNHETAVPPYPPGTAPRSKAPGPDFAAPPVVALEGDDIRLQSDGLLHWLVIQESVEEAWQHIRDFWAKTGTALTEEDAKLGIMETAWIPRGGGLTAYPPDGNPAGAPVEDMYRVRLEPVGEAGGTEVFVTQRARQRASGEVPGQWVPSPSDPGQENDVLQRLMAFMGGTGVGNTGLSTAGSAQEFVKRAGDDKSPSLVLDKPLEMAWRHVGQAVDRFGYTMVGHDRISHKFLIILGPRPPAPIKKAGWFARTFSSHKTPPAVAEYEITLTPGKDNDTVVTAGVVADTGADPDRARKILDEIYEELR